MSDVTDTPAQASGTTAALALLAMLTERYPATFRHEGEPPRPLAIGTGDRLIAERALDPTLVHTAMRLYTRRHAYRHALAQDGAMRVDLDGHEVEPVSQEHQALARAPRTHVAAALAQPDTGPVTLTLDLWKGLTPMAVTATLKLVLRELPATRERDGMVSMALQNAPRGLPKGMSLDSGPLYLSSPVKQWRTAWTRAEQIRGAGTPALLIVEAHVSTKDGAIVGVAKGVQVVEGKAAAPPQA
jgi:RNA chaperone ProQ/FINO-like protein